MDRRDSAELAQLGEHRDVVEVTSVNDQVGRAQDAEAGIRQAAVAAGQVGVGDQGEADGGLFLGRSECWRSASIWSR